MMATARITRKMLPSLAAKNGVQVISESGRMIFQKSGVIVVMYENGLLVRGDVDLSLANPMTVKEVAHLLKLS